ncbi:YicC family protein [bacterium]|nr:MAG: YicC family protein [bacterium]
MIQSMTGYGERTAREKGLAVTASVRSLNSRFLEISSRMPELFYGVEQTVAEMIKKRISRGKVQVTISVDADTKTDMYEVFLDEPLLEKYLSAFSKSKGISGEISAADITSLPDVLALKPKEGLFDRVSRLITESVNAALEATIDMRIAEGRVIEIDLRRRLDDIEKKVKELSNLTELSRKGYLERLRERMAEICEAGVTEERLAQEAAILASKSDPTEEMTRLASHLSQFRETLDSSEPVGSKLRFILQECNRETDTIGAKGDTARVSELVISIKEQLERIREQIQNVE